eukprot:m.82888 g.82888  ORF g.82888 m.82888 type:complete len:94 (-) comp14744_c0_seq6:373-654(-)
MPCGSIAAWFCHGPAGPGQRGQVWGLSEDDRWCPLQLTHSSTPWWIGRVRLGHCLQQHTSARLKADIGSWLFDSVYRKAESTVRLPGKRMVQS